MKTQLREVKDVSLDQAVSRVGLIVDESHFFETQALKREIIDNGINENDIKIIVYRDNFKDKENYFESTFGLKHLNLKNEFLDPVIDDFVSDEFDLLISYYDEEKPFLLKVTNSSKAKFKIGFSTIDKRLNHLMINTSIENYKSFISETFKYLKILNKEIK
ncbi:MAG TPA: hypothetical protein VLC96_11150 [Flavobacterium sp.]|nr:hypothetical protein [Flavobacterium sp.]HSD07794.1 hypothetical protein [Flavobacterium sp.]